MRPGRWLRGLPIACLLLLALPAWADLYVCTTADGRRLSGDRPPPECRDRELRVLNPDGSVRQVIPPPLTKEQRRQNEEKEKERVLEAERERIESQKNGVLLDTYNNAGEIDAARKRTVAARQVLVDRADARLKQYAEEKKKLDDEAEFYAKRKLPPRLQDAYEANRTLSAQQEKVRADALEDIRRINEKFDADLERFRKIEGEAARRAAEARRQAEEQEAPH